MTGYDIYVQWCHDHNRTPPSRAWWERACAQPTAFSGQGACGAIAADQREIDTERREGWAYGK